MENEQVQKGDRSLELLPAWILLLAIGVVVMG